MILVIVPVAILLTAFVGFALQNMTETWARPTVTVSKAKYRWFQLLYSANAQTSALENLLHKATDPGIRYIRGIVSRWTVAHLRPAVQWLTGVNALSHTLLTQVAGLAHDTAQTFDRVHDVWIPRSLHRAEAFAKHGIDALHHALSRDLAILRRYAHGIDRLIKHSILPRVHRLTHAVEHAIPRDIARLGHRVRVLEGLTIKGLRRRLRALERLATRGGFAAAVAIALSTLGLGALRCSALKRILARHGCGLFRAFEDLTALVIDALLISDLCQIMWAMQSAARAAAPAISQLAMGIGDLLQCQNAARPDALTVPWNDPPTPTSTVNL